MKNLELHRSGPSVWDTQRGRMRWDVERWIASMMAGGLFVAAVRKRSAASGVMVAVGERPRLVGTDRFRHTVAATRSAACGPAVSAAGHRPR